MKKRIILVILVICLICCFAVACNETSDDTDVNNRQDVDVNEDGNDLLGDNNDNELPDTSGDEDKVEDGVNGDVGDDVDDNNKDNDGSNVEDKPTNPSDEIICQHVNCVIVGYKENDCEEDGYTGDLYCNDCNTIVRNGENVEKLGHDYDRHFCKNCGNFVIIGKYLGEKITSIAYDDYGHKDEYVEYKELTVSENSVQILHVKQSVKEDLFYYTIDAISKNCSIDYYDANKDDVDSILGNNFVATVDGYKRVTQSTKGDWLITVTENLVLGAENTGKQTTITEEVRTQSGSYSYQNGVITVELDAENFVKSLNFNNDTFMDDDNTMLVKYYVNGKYAGCQYFDDYRVVDNYLENAPDSSISNWYFDNECTLPFDQTNFSASKYKENNEFLCLYARKRYYNTFVFDGIIQQFDINDYQGVSTFDDVQRVIFRENGININTGNYLAEWKENGEVVTAFSVPTIDNDLTSNHIYTLTLMPFTGYCEVAIIDESVRKKEIYFVGNELLFGTYLGDVLTNVLSVSDVDFTNYAYSYLDANSDHKNDVDSVAFTENYLTDNKVLIYRTYRGITVTYVTASGTSVDIIEAGNEYTLKSISNVTVWYEITNGEIVEYPVSQAVSFSQSATLYSSIFTISTYGANNVLSRTIVKLGENSLVNFTTSEKLFDEYKFLGYKTNGEIIYDGNEYSGDFNNFVSSFCIAPLGKVEINCVYEKVTTVHPTKTECGKLVFERYEGDKYFKEETLIPVLSKDNYGYCITSATLFDDGVEIFTSTEFGVYECVIPKLSTYTFTYNEQEITITIGLNNECELIIDGKQSQCECVIDYENKTLTMSCVNNEENIEYLYGVSISESGNFSSVEINSLLDLNAIELQPTIIIESGIFYQYQEIGEYYVAVEEKEIYNSSYKVAFTDFEIYDNCYYVAQENGLSYILSFTRENNVYYMWAEIASGSGVNLPQGNVIFNSDDFQMVVGYLKMQNSLMLYADGTFIYGNYNGKYVYHEEESVYVLYKEVSARENVFVYEINNGEDNFYQTN